MAVENKIADLRSRREKAKLGGGEKGSKPSMQKENLLPESG